MGCRSDQLADGMTGGVFYCFEHSWFKTHRYEKSYLEYFKLHPQTTLTDL
jgi:hypothetical protein